MAKDMLYYIHGYQSSPNSTKGTLFRKTLDAKAIRYQDSKPEDLVISDCMRNIAKEIRDDEDVTLIGSSFGGFLAAKIALEYSNVKKLVLLNPAIIPPSEDVRELAGIPSRIRCEMQDRQLFDKRMDAKISIVIGTEDDVIPLRWIIEFAKIQEATIKFLHDDHSFTRSLNRLLDIICEIIST